MQIIYKGWRLNEKMDNNFIIKNGKKLKTGYTTGSCATAVATAATQMLLSNIALELVKIKLPNGDEAIFRIEDISMNSNKVICSTVKDAGDDPDVTHNIKIFAECTFSKSGIQILGGDGIGIVTCKGLGFNIGDYAINPVPRSMIKQNVSNICNKYDYQAGITIKILVPNGEEIAKKTFNARLGIVGGISILGTTGIVEPMSEKALIDTIKLHIDKQSLINNEKILVSPGNYGRDYCKNNLNIDIDNGIKCSNFIGETLDYLVYKGFKRVLLVGHIGKLIKLAGGIMNTHSSIADCRMEILGVHAALAGANQSVVEDIMDCVTTDSAIEIIKEAGIYDIIFKSALSKIMFHIDYRIKAAIQCEVIMFSQDSIVAKSENADDFVKMFTEE